VGGRVHPQIAWAKQRDGGDREQEVVELNSKVPVQTERKKQESLEVKVSSVISLKLMQQLFIRRK